MKYLDYAATCPLDEDAAKTYIKAATEYFGNSQSLHDIGNTAKQLLERCRFELAQILGVDKEGIYFTSGGSESNFLAIEALLSRKKKDGQHIITGIAEHSSVHSSINRLKERGFRVTYVPLNAEGLLDIEEFTKSICKDTVLAVIQHANSEIGTVQPIAELGKICKEHQILFHTDCVQTFGKLNLKEISPIVDSLSISGHKFYGPKGTGAVYIHPKLSWSPVFPNTTHEKGFRPGTVNVPGIAAMTAAAQKSAGMLEKNFLHYKKLRGLLITTIHPIQQLVHIHGSTNEHQLPSIIGISIAGIEGQWMLLECNRKGFAISTGSACHSGMQAPSQTMTAIGLTGKKAKEFFRVSIGRDTTADDMVSLGNLFITIANDHYKG